MQQRELIPWFAPEMTGGETELLQQVLESGFVNDGPVTRQFEREIAAISGTRHAVAVTSGTVAISCALWALEIGAGDEVLVPDFTFIATANAIAMTGARPVLVDIEPERFSIDPTDAARKITARTRALVSVDVNGRGADYDALERLCVDKGLHLVTDSAEGLGSSWRGRPLGSFGRAGCFSFSASKFVTTGQGGMVVTNDDRTHQRLLELKDQGRPVRGTGGDDLHTSLGYNFKFTDIQAAIGIAQLRVVQERVTSARERDALYEELLANLGGLRFGAIPEPGEARLWADIQVADRKRVETALTDAGIGFRNFWFPLHTQSAYCDQSGPFGDADRVSRQGLWLPSHFRITAEQIERVCDVIRHAVSHP